MKTRLDDLTIINAYVDGELDDDAALRFEKRLVKDKELSAAHARVLALRAALSTKLAQDKISDSLRLKIETAISPPRLILSSDFYWRQMAASIVIAALVGSGATYFTLQQFSKNTNFEAIISGHQRSLLAATPVDVASSDHHTVKPWFDQRLALSPPVPELAAQGYGLQGGRVDVVGGQPVPTLVYKLRQHLISVVAVPNLRTDEGSSATKFATRNGYSVLTWIAHDFIYSAVSDLSKADLEDFETKWRAASNAEE